MVDNKFKSSVHTSQPTPPLSRRAFGSCTTMHPGLHLATEPAVLDSRSAVESSAGAPIAWKRFPNCQKRSETIISENRLPLYMYLYLYFYLCLYLYLCFKNLGVGQTLPGHGYLRFRYLYLYLYMQPQLYLYRYLCF